MEDIPVNVATHIAQRVVDRGIKEASYLCCFNDIVTDFEKEKQNLEAKQQSVQDRVNQAINRTENISIDVEHWLEKANSLIDEDIKTKRSCFFGWLPNCIWRYHRGKDLKSKIQEINRLIESCVFENFAFSSELPDIEYHSSKDFVQFESRSSTYKRLLDALEDGDKYVIGLQGMGGTGKTTLAIEVGKRVKELKLFEHVIKVVVSNTPNIKNIQHEIASPLGLELENEHELDRPKRLWKRLTNGEKILIILDDVWKWLNFGEIGIPLDGDHNSCRVLLTTRDISVCKSMGCRTTIKLELLSKPDAWVLFQKCADFREDSPRTLKTKGQEIACECKGLPVAIAAIASTLKYEGEHEWDLALRSFRNIDHNDVDLIYVYRLLKVSYDYLKVKGAKELFLLCSVFPEDYEISVEDLTIYAIGLGLFGELDSFEKARDRLHRAKKTLIDSCLLLKVDRKKCVKMHDLLHDLAHWIEKGKIELITEPGDNLNTLQGEAIEKQSTLRYLFCFIINDFPDLLDYSKLEILILGFVYKNFEINIPDTFFEGMKNLKVCTLYDNCVDLIPSFRKIPSLPKSFEVLKSLRTLTLRKLQLDDISVLEKLQKLESLRLESCSINEIPIGIAQLKLKLLSLKYCRIENSPYEVLGQIVPQLEELYFRGGYYYYGEVDNEVVTKLLNKNGISPPLQRYHIDLVMVCGLFDTVNDLTSRALAIADFDASTSSATIKDLMNRAEVLHLHDIQGGYRSIVPDFFEAIGDMNELIVMVLKFCSQIEFLIDTASGCSSVGTVFSTLERVALTRMEQLKALCNGSPPSDFLENLQEMNLELCNQLNFTLFVGNLKLKKLKLLFVGVCHKLTSLFALPIAQSLVLLEDLTISNCGALKSIITDESEEKGKEIVGNDHDELSLLPKLQSLKIEDCPQFEALMSVGSNERQLLDMTASSESQASDSQCSYPFDTPQCLLRQSLIFRNIRTMRIVRCHKFTSLFAVSILQTMLLEELVIDSCDELKHIMIDDSKDHDHKKYDFVMPKLKYLSVENCGQLKYVFGQSHHESHLSYPYHNIQIKIDFPALENLILSDLPNILSICQNNYHPKCLALQGFRLIECPQLTIKTVSDFMGYSDARQLACLTRKDSGVNTRYMHTFEQLNIRSSKIEGIICVEGLGVSGQHVISELKSLMLENLSGMSYIFKGPKHMWSLQNLASLSVKGCGKLKVIISTSLVRSLPQLIMLNINDCEELEQIVEEDEEHQNISNPCFKQICFPRLKWFVVKNCSKLKRLFRMSTLNEFPKLEGLIIMEVSDLEEVFGVSDQWEREEAMQNNVLPKLEHIILVELPSLTKLHTVKNRFVLNCPKLSLTSTITVEDLLIHYKYTRKTFRNFGLGVVLESLFDYLKHEADSEMKLCSAQTQSIKGKEKIIIAEIGSSEISTMASASTDSEMIETSSARTSTTDDNELGGEELINEACLRDQQQTMGETEDNTTQSMHEYNPNDSGIESDELRIKVETKTTKAETLQTQEERAPIANSPNLIKVFIEKGLKEPNSKDVVQEDRSTTEAGERLEKPSDVVQRTSLQDKDGQTVANPPPTPSIIPLQKESALELVEQESSNETITMDGMAFGQAKFDMNSKDSPNSIKGSDQEGSVSHISKNVTSSESKRSTSGQIVATLCETIPQDFGSKQSIYMDALKEDRSTNKTSERLEKPSDVAQKISSQPPIKGLQTGTYFDENTKENALDLQNVMDDIHSLFDSMEKDNQLVAKAFDDMETYLNMSLKDIANSEFNSNCLVNALKFLSSWSSGNGSSLEALKATIDSLLQNLPSILSSFKQASTTIDKFTALEQKHKSIKEELPRRKEAANTLEKSIADAQQKKAYLKEKFYRLEAELKSTETEIKEHEIHLSSLKEHGKKLHVDTQNFSKEFETAKKDKSEMVEDRNRAQEQLLEANYERIAFSNQLKQKCSATRNLF